MEVCEPGGVQFIDFGSDPDFNNCVDGLVLVDLTFLKANRYQRYIGVHLDGKTGIKTFQARYQNQIGAHLSQLSQCSRRVAP